MQNLRPSDDTVIFQRPSCGTKIAVASLFIAGKAPVVKTVVASDVTVSSCTGYCPCCVILVASCPRRQQAPRLDESIMRGVLTDRGWSLQCTIAFLCLNPPLCLFALACFLLIIIRAAGNHNHCEYCDFGCVS